MSAGGQATAEEDAVPREGSEAMSPRGGA
jgi:hypothetical protein